jgi:NTE family protein
MQFTHDCAEQFEVRAGQGIERNEFAMKPLPYSAIGAVASKARRVPKRPPFERIALLLQGGGALGSYQAGVYAAMAEAGLEPDWIAGISIGAINGALIAGNAPERRVECLREFWEQITATTHGLDAWLAPLSESSDFVRGWINQTNAAMALFGGAPGFFTPRKMAPWLLPAGGAGATSYYETGKLRSTLERLVDFDRINFGPVRFTVGAVNVRSGNLVCFDTETHRIGPEHVMASGALPPGFPAVEIEGEHYWDGGLVSNTPLEWVVESVPRQDTLAFQVDLWSARGDFPREIAEVETRRKEIVYSSRTRASTSSFKRMQQMRHAAAKLSADMPENVRSSPEMEVLRPMIEHKAYNVIQLIYRAKTYEGHSKDYEFSRRSMVEHWRAGYHDAVRTLRHPEVLKRSKTPDGVFTFDLHIDGRE